MHNPLVPSLLPTIPCFLEFVVSASKTPIHPSRLSEGEGAGVWVRPFLIPLVNCAGLCVLGPHSSWSRHPVGPHHQHYHFFPSLEDKPCQDRITNPFSIQSGLMNGQGSETSHVMKTQPCDENTAMYKLLLTTTAILGIF